MFHQNSVKNSRYAQKTEINPILQASEQAAPAQPVPQQSSGLDAVQKELRKLRKKLDQIGKIKEKQTNGEQLEINQIEKLKTEDELRAQIAQLEIA